MRFFSKGKSLNFSIKNNYGFNHRESESYKSLEISQNDQKKFEISLKGKKLKTPSKKPLLVPSFQLAREIVAELKSNNFITPLFDMTTHANEKEDEDNVLRSFYISFIKDYFRNDVIYNRRPEDTKLGKFQKESFGELMDFIEKNLKIKVPLNYFDKPEDFQDKELAIIGKYLENCDNWHLTAIENLINLTKSSVFSLGVLKNLISIDKILEIDEMEAKYSLKLYGKNSDPHKPLDEKSMELIKTTKKFHDYSILSNTQIIF